MKSYTEKDAISIHKLYHLGYIQEVNRRFFHPLGLHFNVKKDLSHPTEELMFGGIIDVREDPEGIIFTEEEINSSKFKVNKVFIDKEFENASKQREKAFGFTIQPIKGA